MTIRDTVKAVVFGFMLGAIAGHLATGRRHVPAPAASEPPTDQHDEVILEPTSPTPNLDRVYAERAATNGRWFLPNPAPTSENLNKEGTPP